MSLVYDFQKGRLVEKQEIPRVREQQDAKRRREKAWRKTHKPVLFFGLNTAKV